MPEGREQGPEAARDHVKSSWTFSLSSAHPGWRTSRCQASRRSSWMESMALRRGRKPSSPLLPPYLAARRSTALVSQPTSILLELPATVQLS
eukprot:205308-Hanusia_phi.AAC.3